MLTGNADADRAEFLRLAALERRLAAITASPEVRARALTAAASYDRRAAEVAV